MLQLGKSAVRHRKLAMWAALPPYLGGKRRLCPTIFREIDQVVPRCSWGRLRFLDGFLGGGSVSLYAKAQGFAHVTACDIAERGIVVGKALIENSRVRLAREDILRLAAPEDSPPGRVESEMVPSVFTRDQGRFIDRSLAQAGKTEDPAKAALIRLLAIRVALLAHPMSQVRTGTIHRLETGEYESITESCLYHYVDGLRLTRPGKLWEIAQSINAGVFLGRGRVLKENVLDALPGIQADVAYFDPPYPGVMSYEKEYRFIDQILEGISRPTSPFTAKDGASMIDTLFERAQHIPVWVLSLGNAVVTLEELEAKMTRLGRTTRAIEIAYQHLAAVATEEKKATNREFLVVGWDVSALDVLHRSLEVGPRALNVKSHRSAVPLVEENLGTSGSQRLTSESLPDDGLDQGDAPLPEQSSSPPRNAVAVSDRSLDHPESTATKRPMAGDRKRRSLGPGHGSQVPSKTRQSQRRKRR